jgi:hypothetical protein
MHCSCCGTAAASLSVLPSTQLGHWGRHLAHSTARFSFLAGQVSVTELNVGPSLGTSCRRPLGRRPHRLGEVVVGAEAEAADALCGLAGGREHEHHRGVLALGDHPAERVTVDPGEVAVQDDDVVAVQIELHGRLEAFVGDVDRHPFVLQAVDQRVGQRTRVFDDESPHVAAPAASGNPIATATRLRHARRGRACRREPRRSRRRSPAPGRRRDPSRSARRRRDGRAG